MLRRTQALDDLDRRHVREALADMSYREALDRFAALWALARKLDPEFPRASGDDTWREHIGADLTLARVLNGRPADL